MSAPIPSWRPRRLVLGVLSAGLLVTGSLSAVAYVLYDRNENRLLELRVRELGLVLVTAVGSIQTPLASAAALADATRADSRQLGLLLAPDVGPGRQFVSASVWPLDAPRPAAAAQFGVAPALASDPARAAGFFSRVRRTHTLSVIGVLRAGPQLRLGYGFAAPNVRHGYAVYAEVAIPADRRSRRSANSAFSDLHYAFYLGRNQSPSTLLVTDLRRFPLTGRRAADTVPFGDSALTLVVTPTGSLGGTFFELLPWLIAAVGAVLAIAAALLTDRLIRRRERAEHLAETLDRIAAENQQLYGEQRSIAETLQHALLPETLPAVDGLATGVRYAPGTSGIDIGGDWYDLIGQPEGSALIVVGDVAGRGLRAATTMASLRFAVLAYAAEADHPAELLAKLSWYAVTTGSGNFATVLCARLDIRNRSVTLASAGHLPILLVTQEQADYLPVKVGVPIGAGGSSGYEATTVAVPAGSTLIAFTDGLVERRGEVLDAGLNRLRALARSQSASTLDDLLTTLVTELTLDSGHEDDTAILAVRLTR